jgi:hypothetical protein
MSAVRGEPWYWPMQTGVWLAWWHLVMFGPPIASGAYTLLPARTSNSVAAS